MLGSFSRALVVEQPKSTRGLGADSVMQSSSRFTGFYFSGNPLIRRCALNLTPVIANCRRNEHGRHYRCPKMVHCSKFVVLFQKLLRSLSAATRPISDRW